MKKHRSTILPLLVLVIGIAVALYPLLSDFVNSRKHARTIARYTQQVEALEPADSGRFWTDAEEFNHFLLARPARYELTADEANWYRSLLDADGQGLIGYVEIPKLRLKLPVCHGTDEAVLQNGVGHIEGSSLPTGGPGTHCVLSGHRGLPSARLFTDLDELTEGDEFRLHVLDRVLEYQVDQILTVLPDDTAALAIDPQQDLCTLMTCTPYGINSHRLLVRGHRVETEVPTP